MSELQHEQPSVIMSWATSSANYYFGRVVNVALIIFFALQPLSLSDFSFSLSLADAALYYVEGFLVWTLAEYVLHRWLYHDNVTMFAKGHDMHHDEPKSLLGMPWVVYSAVLLGVFWLNTLLTARPTTGLFYSGFWTGYFIYTLVHHGLHHWKNDNKIFKALWRHHKIHHSQHGTNFGVSLTFWDYVFRTKM